MPNYRQKQLTDTQTEGAKQRRIALGNPEFDFVGCCPLMRSRMTASLLTGQSIYVHPGNTIDEFFPMTGSPIAILFETAVQRVGENASFRRVLREPEFQRVNIMKALGVEGENKILKAMVNLHKKRSTKKKFSALFVMNRLVLQAIAVELLHHQTVVDDTFQNAVETTILRDFEGYELVLDIGLNGDEQISTKLVRTKPI